MPPAKKQKSSVREIKKQRNAGKLVGKKKLTQEQIEDKLITARIQLVLKEPFFGSMATRLLIVRDDENIDTAATDGKYFYYNLDFINGLTDQETEFLFGHEVLHNVFEHGFRKDDRNHMLWNIACDYTVNDILLQARIGQMIETALYEPKYKNKCAEEIFEDLHKNVKTIDIDELSSRLLDDHMDQLEDRGKGLSDEEKQEIRNSIKESLLDAAQISSSSGSGKLPAGVDRLINDLTHPKMNWKELLRQDITSVIRSDY